MTPDSAYEPPRSDDALPNSLESDVTVIGARSSITPSLFPLGMTTHELSHALRGEMLGHFLLQQYIGGGGMGVVFKALDTTLDRIVAVKAVASQRVDDDELQRRFLIEAQSTARLDHPNIARVHYIGRDRGLPYIVFEYIDGENIRDLTTARGPLPVAEALSYVYQIAHALAHAWQREVVHRDIKPSNILVTADGQAKLVDMGLARLRQQMNEPENDLTATGITLGTFDYISPEQARDPRLADTRSDIYSLGCTLFYMLAGQAPFAQGTALQKLLQHQSERPPDLRSFRSDVPDSASRLLRRMLAKAPGDRQQTPIELIAELTEIFVELDVPLPSAAGGVAWSLPPRTAPRWKTHALWAAPLATLLAAGLAMDRFSRSGAGTARFPELKQPAPAESTSTAESPANDAQKEAAATPELIEAAPVVDASADDGRPFLPLEQTWDLKQSLWDAVKNWPATLQPTVPSDSGTGLNGRSTLSDSTNEPAEPAPVAPIAPLDDDKDDRSAPRAPMPSDPPLER